MGLHASMRNTTIGLFVAAVLVAGCQSTTAEALLASAKEHISKSERNSAIIQLRNALQKSPQLAEARYLLGRVLLENGEPGVAEKELRKALELRYPADLVLPNLAHTLLALGRFKQVIAEFGELETAAPDLQAELQTMVGQAHLALGETAAAEDTLATALTARPDYAPALFGRVRIEAARGDLAAALANADHALAIAPSYSDGWRLKGDVLRAQGQSDAALVAYRRAVELEPNHLLARSAILLQLAQQRKFDSATEELAAMKRVAPNLPQTLFLQALLAYEQNDLVAAREAIQQQIKAAPDNLQGMLLAGAVEYRLGTYAQAQSRMLKILQRVPDSPVARRILCITYLQSGQPAKALEALKPILHGVEKDADMLVLAGEVFLRNHEPGEAASYFARASALDPSDAPKRTALALSQIANGQVETGVRELQRIAQRDSGIRADLALIATYVQGSEYDKALLAIDALETKYPSDPMTKSLRGTIQRAKGDASAARKSFAEASALNPTFFAATAGLAQLDVAEMKFEDGQRRLQALLEKDPENLPALLSLAELHAKAGGSTGEVETLIRRAVVANPTAPEARIALLEHFVRARDRASMLAAAQEAMAALPDRPELLEAAAGAQLTAGETHQALRTYKRLASLLPDSPLPYLWLADAQLRAKDKDAALHSFGKALALGPEAILASIESRRRQGRGTSVDSNTGRTGLSEEARLLNNIAWAAGQLNDPRAVKYAEEAYELAPSQPAIMDTLGVLLIDKGDITRGLGLLETAAKLEPNAKEIRRNLAKGLIKVGRQGAARKELEELAKLENVSPWHN